MEGSFIVIYQIIGEYKATICQVQSFFEICEYKKWTEGKKDAKNVTVS